MLVPISEFPRAVAARAGARHGGAAGAPGPALATHYQQSITQHHVALLQLLLVRPDLRRSSVGDKLKLSKQQNSLRWTKSPVSPTTGRSVGPQEDTQPPTDLQ